MEEINLIVLVGLPASGKTDFGTLITRGRDDVVYLESEELIVESLEAGKHVLYDSTNISRKKRQALLRKIPEGVGKHVVYVATEFDTILRRNAERDNSIDIDELEKMYKSMQIPILSEGWDSIEFIHDNDIYLEQYEEGFVHSLKIALLAGVEAHQHEVMDSLALFFKEFLKIHELPHDSIYHTLSVSRHTHQVYKRMLEHVDNIKDMRERELMIWTALLHDIGKPFCKSFYNRKGEETVFANYIGHELVGSQIAMTFLKKLNYSNVFIHDVATLIQFHMYLHDEDASEEKLKKRVGEQMFNRLKVLHTADLKSH